MRYIESDSKDPYFNLALEEYVFDRLPREESWFMLWQNANSIIIGKYQNALEEINQQYVDAHGIRVARRLSGGGAVYHDTGNLNFTFIVDQKNTSDFDFSVFVVPVVEALRKLGVEAEFGGRNDILIGGRKISGNSQYVHRGRIMHHGCIMLESNLENVTDALRVKPAKFQSKNIQSVRSRVTTINENAPRPISMEEFKAALRAQVLGDAGAVPYELTAEDLTEIEKLRAEKYATWEWNYGRAKKFSMTREEKFPAGLVTVQMEAENGHIREIGISGDFFGNGDIRELEAGLAGAALDEHLEEKLEELGLGDYMSGITPAELAGLIRG